jgi:hypothetical protein
MDKRKVPDYLRREKGPTLGCADVTVVSIAAITSFIILILILSRGDFVQLFENFTRNNTPVIVAPLSSTPTRTPSPRPTTLVALTPTPPPPTPTPVKKAALKTSCNLRPEPTTRKGSKGEFRPGISFIILGNPTDAEGIRWINVELDDGSKNQGWMWETCFDLGQ